MSDHEYPGFWSLVRSDLDSYLQRKTGASPLAIWFKYWGVAYEHPGSVALLANRAASVLRNGKPDPITRFCFRVWAVLLRISATILGGSWISGDAQIGKGARHMHQGGVIVNGATEIGDYCDIWQGVNLIADQTLKAPKIGNWVTLGANCMVIGGVEVGDFAVIGAGAVVTKNVPAGGVVVGVPGRVVKLLDSALRPEQLPERGNVSTDEYDAYVRALR
ncbi:MAG: DapH/DapD/GlmU-related protein [Fimbriimonadales bacterium]